jgi:hypothetical protein
LSSTVAAGYDPIGELTSWTAQEANGAPRLNEQLGYAYDPAGNLKQRINCYELIWYRTFPSTGIVAFLPNSRARVEFCSRIAAVRS